MKILHNISWCDMDQQILHNEAIIGYEMLALVYELLDYLQV